MEVDDQDVQNTSCRIDSFGNGYIFPYQFNSSLCDRMTMIINNFFQRNQMTENYSEVLRYVSIFSANSNSEELANAIQSTIQSNVNRIMDDLTMNYLQNDDTSFMNYMAENWLKFYGCIKKIRELIVFYDYSFYIPKLHQSFYSKCIDIWKDTFVSSTYARIQEKTYTSMLNYLYLQREQCSITPNETLLTIVKMLNEVQLYEQFEKKLISSQCDFYNELVDRMTDEQKPMEPSLYIQKFKECIAFETSISDQLLNHYSLLSLLNTIYYCFITLPSHYLFDYAVEILIEHQYFDELTTLYIYCEKLDTSSKLNLISRLKQATCQYITKKGNQIYKMNKNYTNLIDSLLDLNQLMNRLNDCYHKNGTLSLSINDTMRNTISQEEHLVINSLVLYIHSMILQLPVLSSSKKSTNQFERNSKEKDLFFDQSVSTLEELKTSIANDQFTDFIDQCVQIYTFIAKKDEFENIYKIYLSKRLLLFHSLHFSHEQYVITSLSKENTKCVQCLLTIMEDMKRSYKFTKEISISTYYPVNCTIVSKSIWSLYDDESKDGDVEMKEKVSIPEDQDISIYKTKFCKKYMQRYTNPETMKAERQIFISDYDSYYYISMKLNKKNYTFYTTFYQYFILSQFSKRPTYTYNELKSISNFSDSILQKALQPILYIKLLVTDDANITPNSKITFNSSFADNISEENKEMLIIRGVINLDCMNDSLFKFESNSDDDQTQITDTQINAAIVRLLKKVKEMSFDKIVNSLNEEFNTHLDVDQVKACIDHLITKECIEHKDNQPDILVYC